MKAVRFIVLLGLLACVSGYVSGAAPAMRGLKSQPKRTVAAYLGKEVSIGQNDQSMQSIVAEAAPQSKVAGSWRGPACVLGGAMAHLTLGTLYCWGNFLSYAPAYLRYFDGMEHIGSQPDAIYVLPLTILAQAAAMPFGPSLVKVLGASRTMLLGSWIAATAVYLASYQRTLQSFILFYSLMFGAGAGLAYTAPMAAGWKWMPNSKGLVSGGVLAGFGAGGFIFSYIGSKHVNPTAVNMINGAFPPSVYANFPSMLRKLALIYAAVSFFGALLVSEPVVSTSSVGGSGSSVGSGNGASGVGSGKGVSDSNIEKESIVAPQVVQRRVIRVPRVPKEVTIGKVRVDLQHLHTLSTHIPDITIPQYTIPQHVNLTLLLPLILHNVVTQLQSIQHALPVLVHKLPAPVLHFITHTLHLKLPEVRKYTPTKPTTPTTTTITTTRTDITPPVTTNTTTVTKSRGLSVVQALTSSQFWLLWSLIITSATAGLNTASVYKTFATTSPYTTLHNDQFLTLVGGLGALCNGLGRVIWGLLLDKMGFKRAFGVLTVLQAGSMLSYFYAAESKANFALNTCMLFFTLAGNFALFPPAVQRIFGPEQGTVIYGILYSAFAASSIGGGILTKKLVNKVGWQVLFQIMAGMSVFASLLVNLVSPVRGYEGSVV